MKNLFLTEDHAKVEKLLSEFDRYINLSIAHRNKREYDKAEKYAEHAQAMVAQVRKLRQLKEMYDESHSLKSEIKMQGLADSMIQKRKTWF